MNSSRSPRTVTLRKRPNFPTFGVYLGNDVPSGVYVVTVQPHSPAAQAKIQPGDRVLAVNDQLVSSMPKNAKDMIVDLAQHAQSLSLTIQPTDLFEALDGLLHSTVPVDRPASTVKPSSPIDRELEKYVDASINHRVPSRVRSSDSSNRYLPMKMCALWLRRRRTRMNIFSYPMATGFCTDRSRMNGENANDDTTTTGTPNRRKPQRTMKTTKRFYCHRFLLAAFHVWEQLRYYDKRNRRSKRIQHRTKVSFSVAETNNRLHSAVARSSR